MSSLRALPVGLTLFTGLLFVAGTALAAPVSEHPAKALPGVEQQFACAVPTPKGPLGY